mmetsp:Transcript_23949/g.36426  ORF Transcript_23949/g.36426 Transcript_23949/m.36426 type:complete len:307 (+) Transcript_23949:103-1023(+)
MVKITGLSNGTSCPCHWASLLTDIGSQMTNLGSRMSHLGNQDSKPERRDLSQLMTLGSQLLRVGSVFLNDTPQNSTSAATVCSKRRTSLVQAKSNKRTRFSFVVSSQPEPASFENNSLSSQSLSPVTPCPSDGAPNLSPLNPGDELDEYLLSTFSESVGRSSFVFNELNAPDGASTSMAISPTKKSRKTGEGRYLKRFVANTFPKMTLKTYFEHHDGSLICLCGRGAHNKHPGNKNYRDFVSSWSEDYRSLSKEEKEERTNSVVQEFESHGWRIFKLNGEDEWEELSQDLARTKIRAKISQRFRDS